MDKLVKIKETFERIIGYIDLPNDIKYLIEVSGDTIINEKIVPILICVECNINCIDPKYSLLLEEFSFLGIDYNDFSLAKKEDNYIYKYQGWKYKEHTPVNVFTLFPIATVEDSMEIDGYEDNAFINEVREKYPLGITQYSSAQHVIDSCNKNKVSRVESCSAYHYYKNLFNWNPNLFYVEAGELKFRGRCKLVDYSIYPTEYEQLLNN